MSKGVRLQSPCLLALTWVVAFASQEALAQGPLSRCAEWLVPRAKSHIIDKLRADYAEQELHLREPKPAQIKLGRLLGTGMFAGVYNVDSIDDAGQLAQITKPELLEVVSDREIVKRVWASDPDSGFTRVGNRIWLPLVAKFGHALKFLTPYRANFITEAEIQKEAQTYDLLVESLPGLEAAPVYPKDPAWRRGRLPIAPVATIVPTEMGSVLIKMFVDGLSLSKLAERHGSELPPEMVAGLEDLYDFSLAVHRTVQVDARRAKKLWRKSKEGFALDIRPDNAVWVEKPAMLKLLGYTRPGWVLFEGSQIMLNVPQYQTHTTKAEYLELVRGYLKRYQTP